MHHLDEIDLADLQIKLHDGDDATPALRLTVAINLKNDVDPDTIADWYDLAPRTVYNWKTRFETQPLEEAIHDAPRSGRPPKLTADEKTDLLATLQGDPQAAGVDAPAWTTAHAQAYIEDTYDVSYTPRHVRRLMKEAGLSYRTARPEHHEADPEEQAAFREELKTTSGGWTTR
jgi:transposase